MKTQDHPIEASINALFRRCPTLCGFTVRDEASQLFVTGVSVYPCSGLAAPGELWSEIMATLAELVDECPEAGELLRERTFARAFH